MQPWVQATLTSVNKRPVWRSTYRRINFWRGNLQSFRRLSFVLLLKALPETQTREKLIIRRSLKPPCRHNNYKLEPYRCVRVRRIRYRHTHCTNRIHRHLRHSHLHTSGVASCQRRERMRLRTACANQLVSQGITEPTDSCHTKCIFINSDFQNPKSTAPFNVWTAHRTSSAHS